MRREEIKGKNRKKRKEEVRNIKCKEESGKMSKKMSFSSFPQNN